jgi:hypothetical protein
VQDAQIIECIGILAVLTDELGQQFNSALDIALRRFVFSLIVERITPR